ncbi:MAG TPA: hypothetical protein VGZ29_16815 [Terriglobia bacterium]|nr:hypothetical protein [Terriglobia bacterium]
MRIRWFFGFFLLSGFCSLVYEVVWLRLAMAKFGVTTPMVSIVLSVFMAGLGLGSWAGGAFVRRFDGSPRSAALRLYGLTELLIGASGLLVPALIDLGSRMLAGAGANLAWQSSTYYLASGGWICVALLPWCTCMGATFPFAMAAIRRLIAKESARSFSYLYLANVLGAVLGTLVATFVLIELLGFTGTLHAAVALNAILAATVFALSFRRSAVPQPIRSPSTAPARRFAQSIYASSGRVVLWLLFTTGLCTMAMEVIWIRQYTAYLGNVVYAFAEILGFYLAATFAGSRIYRGWVRSHDPGRTAPAWILSGLLALLPLVFADPHLPVLKSAHAAAWRAALGIVPFSSLLGFLTPMLVDQWSSGDPNRAGRAYAVNIVGAILGPLMAGFWILPWLGDRWGLYVMSLPLFLIGLLAALYETSSRAPSLSPRKTRALYAGVVVSSVILAAFARGYEAKYPDRVLRRDYTATVIATGSGMDKRLLVNGLGMTNLTPITKVMAHFPLALLDRAPKNGLVICFGMGTTFRSMMSWGIPTTAVELVPSVPKLFGYFHPDGPALLGLPSAHLVIDDGRRFLERSAERYDVITVDPPPPPGAATSSLLYSVEFLRVARAHLNSGGILQIWLPGADDATQASVAKAVSDCFPYVRVFTSIKGWGFHFVASDKPLPVLSADELASRLPPAAAADFVEWGPAPTTEGMFALVLEHERPVADFVAEDPRVPPLQDDQPINEYFYLRSRFHYYR